MPTRNETAIRENAEIRIIRRRQVEARTGLSRSTIYAKTTPNPKRPQDYDPTFPKPVKLGASSASSVAVGWVEHEIDAWLAALINNRRKA